MSFSFSKYSGCGNDFIIFDNRKNEFPGDDHQLIAALCERRIGIGADGILLLEQSSRAHHKMRIFNSDGFETEMCGNGLRCFVRYLQDSGLGDGPFKIETMKRDHYCLIEGDMVTIEMGDPLSSDIRWNFALQFNNQTFQAHYIDTGVPHVVIFTSPLKEIDVARWGAEIRNSHLFQPRGTNVNFVEIEDNEVIHIRTFERGVEAETLACGTGATAAALAAAKCYGLHSPIAVKTRIGDLLYVSFEMEKEHFQKITLTGPAEKVFDGSFKFPFPLLRTHSFAYN